MYAYDFLRFIFSHFFSIRMLELDNAFVFKAIIYFLSYAPFSINENIFTVIFAMMVIEFPVGAFIHLLHAVAIVMVVVVFVLVFSVTRWAFSYLILLFNIVAHPWLVTWKAFLYWFTNLNIFENFEFFFSYLNTTVIFIFISIRARSTYLLHYAALVRTGVKCLLNDSECIKSALYLNSRGTVVSYFFHHK